MADSCQPSRPSSNTRPAKAFLVELSGDTKVANPDLSKSIPVQFNPTSLRLQLTNNSEGGKSRPKQVQQHVGEGTTTLSLDLVYDSADEGTSSMPVDVRTKIKCVEKFVLPGAGSKQAPPRVGFLWGTFFFQGVMSSLNEDIDLFSAEGVPLRAKVSISIRGQDPELAALAVGPGASTTLGPSPTEGSGAGPGSAGAGPTNQTALAIGGESLADFAARMGIDPSAWRGLAAGIAAPLSLQAGLQIDFNASLSAAPGVGVAAGAQAGVAASLSASLGLEPSATADLGPFAAAVTAPGLPAAAPPGGGPGGPGPGLPGAAPGAGGGLGAVAAPGSISLADPGFALAAAGGLAAAVETAKSAAAHAAATTARSAFRVPAPAPVTPRPAPGAAAGPPAARSTPAAVTAQKACLPTVIPSQPGQTDQSRRPLRLTGVQAAVAQGLQAPPQVAADPRATSYGLGVPLRPAITGAARDRRGLVSGGTVVGRRPAPSEAPSTGTLAAAPWQALPPVDPGRTRADRAQLLASIVPNTGSGA